MAIDHRIPLMTETPRINTPFENLRVVMDAKAAEQQVQGNALKLQEAERAAREQAEAQRILQEAGGDWEVALPRLRQVAPGQALAFEKHLGEQRKAGAEAVKLELANERDMTERGLALLRAAKAAPEMYGAIRQYVGQMVPDLGPLLPEQYDPATLDQLESMGLTAAQNIEQKGKALQLFADGKLTDALGTALSAAVDEEDWNEALEAAKVYGVPAEVRAMFGQWSPDAPQRAAQLALSPKERADIQDAEVGREIQRGQLDVSRGQLGVAQGQLGVARQRVGLEGQRVAQAAQGGGSGERLPTPTARLNATLSLQSRYVAQTKAAAESARAVGQMRSALAAVKSGAAAPGSQGILVTFQKILDPESVVRESEYARSASGLALMSRLEGAWMRIREGGAGVPVHELEKFVALAEEWNKNAQASAQTVKRQIDGIATEYGLRPENITRDYGTGEATQSPAPAGGGSTGGGFSATPSDYEAYKRRRQGGR